MFKAGLVKWCCLSVRYFLIEDFEYLKFLNNHICNKNEQDFMLTCFDKSI